MAQEIEIELEDYYDLSIANQLSLSPDGERVAFIVSEFDGEEDERLNSLFVAPTDGSEQPYRLTRVSNASSPKWSPDGEKLGFIAQRDEDVELKVGSKPSEETEDDESEEGEDKEGKNGKNGEEEPKSQVWVFDLKRGGDARQVTDFDEGAREFDWSPDSKRIAVSARDPTEEQKEYLESRRDDGPIVVERLQHKFDGAGWLDDVKTYLFVVDLETREKTRLDDAYGGGIFEARRGLQPAWGPNDRIAFLSNRTENPDDSYVMDVYTITPEGNDLEKVTNSDVSASSMRWSPSGDKIAFVGRDPENWHIPTQVYVAFSDDWSYESVSESLDRTVSWGGAPRWLDNSTLLSSIGDGGRTRLVRLYSDGSEPERVFDDQGDYRGVSSFDAEGEEVAMIITQPNSHDVYSMGLEDLENGAELTRITNLNHEITEGYDIGCERVTFENSDGDEVESIVYYPPDFSPNKPEPHPVIASIHGGPMAYDEPSFDFKNLYWTNEGYVVIRVNYRGSTSYGRDFSEVIRGDWGPREVDDIKSGIEHLIDKGWVNDERVFITGFSQGGVNTAYFVTMTDMATAAAAEHGVYDYRSSFGTDDSHRWWENDFGLPWENPEVYDKASSITDVGEIDTPLLVTAGENDWRCPPTQAEQLYVSVKKQGVPSKLIVYPNENHSVTKPKRGVHRLRNLTEWFKEHDPAIEDEDEN
ncbi:MAG: S9 family peptidase [Halobacteria archaeon]|nr:S9 family peptidase [Halobacteria archaeon]